MNRIALMLSLSLLNSSITWAGDWPAWRGPHGNSIADADQNPPLKWNATENIQWKVPIPGRAYGSPIVVGKRVYLTTAERDREARSLRCLNRQTGELIWNCDVHIGKVLPHKNKKGSDASSTPACDGESLFINFLHDDAMWTSAVSMDGEIQWQQEVCKYQVHQGFGSSPVLFEDLVIVIADNKLGGTVAGLRRKTGEFVWQNERPKMPNYASPVIHQIDGQPQVILTGCELVTGLNPRTGETLWEIEGATTECVSTTPRHDNIVFSSGGYPRNHVAAIRADGSGEIVWENGTRVYVPSMLVADGFLYGVTDAGVAVCWNAETGEEMWKGRLGGTFSGSLVLVKDRLYVTNESGTTFVFHKNPESFKLLSENELPSENLTTPAICNNQIFLRIAELNGETRQEYLYCIGQ